MGWWPGQFLPEVKLMINLSGRQVIPVSAILLLAGPFQSDQTDVILKVAAGKCQRVGKDAVEDGFQGQPCAALRGLA
jgi:hypothetical protein